MKRCFWIAACCVWMAIAPFGQPAAAQLNEEQVQQYVGSFGWTMDDLRHYLSDYGMTLNDFATLAELKEWLGTPITEANLDELLARYGLTKEELEALLGQFGETLQDYTFIEDLDMAVDFYLHHDEEMQQVNDMLGAIGFTEQEASRLFDHIMSLDETDLAEKFAQLDERIEPFLGVEDPTALTAEQQDELFSIWEEMLAALELQPKFYLIDGSHKQEVPYRQLMAMQSLGGRDLLVEMYNLQGELLADMQLSEEMLESGYIVRAGESLLHAGEIGGEMKEKMMGDKMPNTASPYAAYMLFGAMLVWLGWAVLRRSREGTAE